MNFTRLAGKTRYRIVETRWGYFGLKTGKGGLVQTCLPMTDPAEAEQALGLAQQPAPHDSRLFPELQQRIVAYYTGQPVTFLGLVPLDLGSFTAFGQAVLRACHGLPYGETRSYGQLAQAAGHPGAARAVGQIMARNPIPLIIPCHRVTAARRQIGGFSAPGGIETKHRMLKMEDQGCGGAIRASRPRAQSLRER